MGETMKETIIRECKEELNLEVKPLRLVLARDYIAKNHNQPYDLDCFHLAELMFECNVTDFTPLGNGSEPDSDAQKIKWIELDQLADSDFYPKDSCFGRCELGKNVCENSDLNFSAQTFGCPR